ncbi:MAG: transporter [Candidatus Hydrogenedentes bacterium]|nr:transporter [Candidatus Hydrogenedentota bacterium]
MKPGKQWQGQAQAVRHACRTGDFSVKQHRGALQKDTSERNVFSVWSIAFLLVGVVCLAGSSWALDPTTLEPVEPGQPHLLTLQEETQYDHFHHYDLVSETNLLYDFTKNLGGELTVPAELGESDTKGVGDVRLRLKYVFNPDAETDPMVALSGEVALPTAKDSAGVGGDVDLRITMPLGEGDAHHKLHLTLKETYFSGADTNSWRRWSFEEGRFRSSPGDREFAYQVVLGYSRLFGPATEFRADFDREQLDEKGRTANVIQAGFTHDLGASTSVMLGAGVGLGADAPDFRIRTGIEYRFGGPGK